MLIPEYIEIKNVNNQTVAFLSPEDGLKECFSDYRLNGESTLEFKLPINSEKLTVLTPECIIVAGSKEYTLLKEDAIDIEMDQAGTLWAKVMAEETWRNFEYVYAETPICNDPGIPNPSDLAVIIVAGGSDLSGGRYAVGSAGHALYALLQGTGWSVGTVDVTGTHDLETEKESILANIKQVREIWGGYLVFDSINKTVSLRNENTWQNYNGFQIRYAKNMKHITRTQSNRIISRLYPFGKDNLDISSVNGGVKYIDNHTYTSAHYVGTYRNPDIEDAQELKDRAEYELSLMCQPQYVYRVNIADLRTLPEYSHEDFAVGDMADVIHSTLGITSRVRILRHKYNLFMPWQCELELGNPEHRFVEKLAESFKNSDYITETIDSQGQFPGTKLTPVSVGSAKLADAAVTTAKIANLAVNTDKLAALAVDAAKLADSAVTATKIANAAVGSAAIANAAIGSAHIGTGVILNAHIGDLQVSGAKIANAAITDAKIANLSADKITTGTLTGRTVRTAASGTRIELTDGNIFRCYNQDGHLHGLFFAPDTWADLFVCSHGYEIFRIQDDYPDTTVSLLTLGHYILYGSDTTAYPLGRWDFWAADTVDGLDTTEHSQSHHNHGITPGLKLAVVDESFNIIGYVVWSASGGFSHSHDVKKA